MEDRNPKSAFRWQNSLKMLGVIGGTLKRNIDSMMTDFAKQVYLINNKEPKRLNAFSHIPPVVPIDPLILKKAFSLASNPNLSELVRVFQAIERDASAYLDKFAAYVILFTFLPDSPVSDLTPEDVADPEKAEQSMLSIGPEILNYAESRLAHMPDTHYVRLLKEVLANIKIHHFISAQFVAAVLCDCIIESHNRKSDKDFIKRQYDALDSLTKDNKPYGKKLWDIFRAMEDAYPNENDLKVIGLATWVKMGISVTDSIVSPAISMNRHATVHLINSKHISTSNAFLFLIAATFLLEQLYDGNIILSRNRDLAYFDGQHWGVS